MLFCSAGRMNGVPRLLTLGNSINLQCLVSPPGVLGGFGLENEAPPRTPTRITTSFGFRVLPAAIAIFFQIFSLVCGSSMPFALFRAASRTIAIALRADRRTAFFIKRGLASL